jgi:hypothetical protein
VRPRSIRWSHCGTSELVRLSTNPFPRLAFVFVYHGRTPGESVQPQTPDVELRISELQTQIDRLSLALRQWRETQEQSQSTENRLAHLTAQSAEILSRWTVSDERHREVVAALEARLKEWDGVEARLQQDAGRRARELELAIEREWRRVHEEPVKQLREQAETLGETCVAAANLALRGFERAEARVAALEADLQTRMNQLSHEVRTAIADGQGAAGRRRAALPGAGSPFPLESIMRVHDELRESDEAGKRLEGERQPSRDQRHAQDAPTAVPLLTEAAALSERMESLERELTSGREEVRAAAERTKGMERIWRAVAVLLVLTLVGGGAYLFVLKGSIEASLRDAAARAAAAERQAEAATDHANKQTAATSEDSERRLVEARETAQRAEIISGVLAAPDLRRVILVGSEAAPRAFGQVLWSRTRGLVFSASRLPPARDGATYQLWFLTSPAPVSGGLLVPDSTGTVTLASETSPEAPRAVTGVVVTLEPSGGSPVPSGATVLTRVVQ